MRSRRSPTRTSTSSTRDKTPSGRELPSCTPRPRALPLDHPAMVPQPWKWPRSPRPRAHSPPPSSGCAKTSRPVHRRHHPSHRAMTSRRAHHPACPPECERTPRPTRPRGLRNGGVTLPPRSGDNIVASAWDTTPLPPPRTPPPWSNESRYSNSRFVVAERRW